MLQTERRKQCQDVLLFTKCCHIRSSVVCQFTFQRLCLLVAHAPRFKVPAERTLKVVKGTNLDLNCTVDAAPLPEVKWVDSKDRKIKPRPNKVLIFPNHTLRFKDLDLVDSGVFYCNVTNRYGINRIKRVLEVYGKEKMVGRLARFVLNHPP